MRARLTTDALWIALAVVLGGGTLLLFGWFLWHGALRIVNLGLTTAAALAFDALLSLAFFLQHSLMLRTPTRRHLAGLVPVRYHGALFAIASGMVLAAVVFLWQPAGPVWIALDGAARVGLRILLLLPLVGTAWAALSIRGFDPFGAAPIVAHRRDEEAPQVPLVVRGPYRFVRQPMYALVLVMLWVHPTWTADRLVFAVLWSLWVVVGAWLEERDLERVYGDAWLAYQRRVPMLMPRLGLGRHT